MPEGLSMRNLGLIVLMIIAADNCQAGIIDLGTFGSVCVREKNTNSPKPSSVSLKEMYKNADVSFSLRKIKGIKDQDSNAQVIDPMDQMLENKTFFIFGTDTVSLEKARNAKADYGICVKYNSALDVSRFIKDAELKFPVLLGNDDIVSLFKVSKYPIYATIKNGVVSIENDF